MDDVENVGKESGVVRESVESGDDSRRKGELLGELFVVASESKDDFKRLLLEDWIASGLEGLAQNVLSLLSNQFVFSARNDALCQDTEDASIRSAAVEGKRRLIVQNARINVRRLRSNRINLR